MQSNPPNSQVFAVPQQELANITSLFKGIKLLRAKLSGTNETTLDNAFETHVLSVIGTLEERLGAIESPFSKESEVVMAQHGLYDASFQQAILMCQAISPLLGDYLKDIRAAHSGMFSNMQRIVNASVERESTFIEAIKAAEQEVDNRMQKFNRLKKGIDVLDKENEDLKNSLLLLKQQLREVTTELNDYKDGINVGGGSMRKIVGSTIALTTSTDSAPKVPGSRALSSSSQQNALNSSQRSVSSVARSKGSSLNGSVYASDLPPSLSTAFYHRIVQYRVDIQRAMDDNRCRDISLNETLELIDKMFDSKMAANEKVYTTRTSLLGSSGPISSPTNAMAIETMELHIYNTLEKKYGLRALAYEHAGNFVNALYKYRLEHNYVAAFYKIFQNTLEEGFFLTIRELRKTIRDLLLVQVLSKNSSKDSNTVNLLLEAKMNSYIYEEEWIEIMNYLYNENDSTAITLIIRKLAAEEMQREENEKRANSPRAANPINNLLRIKGGSSITSDGGKSASSSKKKVSVVRQPIPQVSNPSTTASSGPLKSAMKTSSQLTSSGSSVNSAQSASSVQTVTVFNNPNPNNKLRILFSSLQKAVLDYQLKVHDEYLKYFKETFHQADDDADGILSTDQFYQVYQMMGLHKPSSKYLSFPGPKSSADAGQDSSSLSVSRNNGSNSSDLQSLDPLLSRLKTGSVSSELDLESLASGGNASTLSTFAKLVNTVDPLGTDIITFSECVNAIHKMPPSK